MQDLTTTSRLEVPVVQAPTTLSIIDRLARSIVLRALATMGEGKLTLHEQGQAFHYGRRSTDSLAAHVHVHDPAFFRRVAMGGSIGAAEGYMAGHWTTDELTSLVRLMIRNSVATGSLERWAQLVSQPLLRVANLFRPNNRAGSRRNIAAHYDLGNEFFVAWLDESLTYSSGVYPRPNATLCEAQRHKCELVCRKLDFRPGERLLEVGCGWGGLAVHAARDFGCHVIAATISQRQFEFARQRVRAAGLEDRVDIVLQDYRELRGQFDKLVSVEMIESVGRTWLPTYFAACSRLLQPGGRMLLQAIAIADELYPAYCRSVDFIQRYIFPGGHLPSLGALRHLVQRHTDLRIVEVEDLTHHYAQTLCDWRTNFLASRQRLRDLGLTDEFLRMWEFYLSYCEAGFLEGQLGLAQIVLDKPAI